MPYFLSVWDETMEEQKLPLKRLIGSRTRADPITSDELGESLGLNWDQVWGIIQRLWDEGEPICTMGYGFWLAEDRKDVECAAAYLLDQAQWRVLEADGFLQAIANMTSHQVNVWPEGGWPDPTREESTPLR